MTTMKGSNLSLMDVLGPLSVGVGVGMGVGVGVGTIPMVVDDWTLLIVVVNGASAESSMAELVVMVTAAQNT